MYKLEYNKLRKVFNKNFVKITSHNKYGTRQATSSKYFVPRVGKIIVQNQLSFRASKLWRTINLQIKNKQLDSFTKQYTYSLLKS